MKKILQEFRDFINRGNVVDMAIGIMIGAAFKAIVDSLVNDIISPLIGLVVQENFKSLTLTIFGVQFAYGSFIMALLNFFIIAVVLFCIIKVMNVLHSLGKKEQVVVEEAPTTKVCPYCKSEIPVEATRCAHCTSELAE